MKIIDLMPEHEQLYFVCLEDWSDEMKDAGNHKELWYNKMKDKGLRASWFRKREYRYCSGSRSRRMLFLLSGSGRGKNRSSFPIRLRSPLLSTVGVRPRTWFFKRAKRVKRRRL